MRRNEFKGVYLALIMAAGAAGCGDSGPSAPLAPASVIASSPSSPPPAPSSNHSYVVSGVVTELTGSGSVAVAGAYVEVCGYDSAYSDKDGSYRLSTIPGGTIVMLVRAEGFRELLVSVAISSDTRFDLQMERE